MLQRVLDLVGALRSAGVPATQSEAIDAVRALRHVDLLDRRQLREALAATCLTGQLERPVFDQLFELHFPVRHVDAEAPEVIGPEALDAPFDPDAYHDELVKRLASDDEADRRQAAREAVDRFARVEGRDGTTSWFSYRVSRAIDADRLREDLLARFAQSDPDDEPAFVGRLRLDEVEARLREFRDEVDDEIRRRAAAQRGVRRVAERTVRPPAAERDFFQLTADDQAQLRAQARTLARKLASRVAIRRRHSRQGRLDLRRTVRRSLSTGGVPFDLVHRPRRPHKPELFVICDVSGSVASFARFTLLLVHSLQEQFSRVRSFAFIDTLDEVTRLFEESDAADAVVRMMREADLVWLDGHSDYGHSLERFHEAYARDLGPRSTVLVLGDARNNHRQANAWVLADVARRARRVYWLNPEQRGLWDTGDSIASSYARHVDEMVEVRNLRQLAAFVERIA